MTVSAKDHSIGVGGDVYGGVHITQQEGESPLPDYEPPEPPDPGDAIPAPGNLPSGSHLLFTPNANFTGREEALKALAQELLHGEGTTLITQAIQGMGGIGKTQLAVEFAHRYGRYFHGVHWINAEQPEGIEGEIAQCGQLMRLQPWPQKLPEQVASTLAAWKRNGSRLIILDNLEEVEAARQWLGKLSGGPLRVLLTARRTDWPGGIGLRPLRLDTFTPEESRAFLRKTSEVSETSEVLDKLADRLGHLPLALELAGRYLKRHRRKRVEDYMAELDEIMTHRSMSNWRNDLGNPTGHDLDLMATFALSWDEVEDEAAQRLFLMAGYCAPNEPIPCELLERAADLSQDECDEALNLLTGLGLLELPSPQRGGVGGGVTIPPLLAEYARAQPAGVRGEGLPALADTLATMTNESLETGLPERFQPLRPHARAVAEWAEEAEVEDAGTLWNNLGSHLCMVADYAGARASYERALRIDEAVFGTDHPKFARDVNNLGSVQHALGDLEGARTSYERALCIGEVAFGRDHPEIASMVNNLGVVQSDLGDLAGARASLERALRIWRTVYGEEHPQVATGLNNLGSMQRALGELEGARASYERALRIDEAVFGPHHPNPNVARDVSNLGSVQKALGDLEGALVSFERALRIFERVLGPEHPNVASVVNNLGSVQQDLNDLERARVSYERALRIWRAAYGDEHPQVATGFNNLGSVQQAQGDLAGARASYERALRILENSQLPPDHPYIEDLKRKLEALG